METHVSLTFNNFTISSNTPNTPFQFELSYETKKIKFEYPQTEPLNINFSSKFIHDKISLVLSTTIESGNNKKKLIPFRGDITLNKTIFSENNKTIYEKNITMIPIEPIKEIKEMKDNKKIGKIFMQIQLLDPIEDWKKSFKSMNKKKSGPKLKNNLSNNNDSASNTINTNLNNNSAKNINKQSSSSKKQKQSGEIDSEINVEPIFDEMDDNKANNELNKLISLDQINQLKEILKKDYKKIFPNDINEMKTLNENLYQKYNQLSIKYNEILKGLNTNNENMRRKIVECYNEYKDLKARLDKKTNEQKLLKKNIDSKITKNKLENDNIIKNLQKFNDEKDFFYKKLTSPKQEEKLNNNQNMEINESLANIANNPEIKTLKDAIKKISTLGYDLLDGLNITDEEKKILNMILDENSGAKDIDIKNNKDNEQEYHDKEAEKEDFDLSNRIVGLIERDVNDLYSRKLIEQVKIDQIDAITYSFIGNTKTKEVEFRVENNNLVCNTGESFTVWLISNFSL